MNLNLTGKIAIVAGGSRGIGLAIAQTLAAEGASVAIAARALDILEAARLSIGAAASAHQCDATDADQATRFVREAVERWGRIDIAVCNVGSGRSVPPGQEDASEWQRVLHVNLLSATNVIAAVRPEIRAAGGGSIVCVSSICGIEALGAPVTYSAAKAALNATVRGLARPLAKEGIRINAVAPGNILFDGSAWQRRVADDPAGVRRMLEGEVALARFGTPEEVAAVVSFLASPCSGFVTGAIYVVDGGQLRG